MHRFWASALACWLMLGLAHAALDPLLVGVWETSGINQFGPWRVAWDLRADGTYFISGALTDHGRIEASEGVWKTTSDTTRLEATGTYEFREADWLSTNGPLGKAEWKRAQASTPAPAPSPAPAPLANLTPPPQPAPPMPAPTPAVPPASQISKEDARKAAEAFDRGTAAADRQAYDKAIAAFSEAIELSPRYTDAWNSRGLAHYHRGDFDKALADYNQAIQLDLNFSSAYGNRALVWLEKEDYKKIEPDFERCYQINPQARGIFDQDERTICNLHIAKHTGELRQNPKDANAYFDRARAYEQLKDYGRALADLNQALRYTKEAGPIYMTRGNIYLETKDYDRAIEDFVQSLRVDPSDPMTFLNRGVAYERKGNHRAALDDFTSALRLKPDYAKAYIGRGNNYANLKEDEKAINDYTLADKNGYAKPWVSANKRAICYNNLQKPDLALAEANKALQLNPQFSYAYFSRLRALKALGRAEEARNDYLAITKLPVDEKNEDSFHQRANAYYSLEDYEHALQDYTKAISIDSSSSTTYWKRGDTYKKLKKYGEAIRDYSQALTLDPKDCDTLLARADAYMENKQIDQAIADSNQAIRMKPDAEENYRGLAWFDLVAGRPHDAIQAAQKGLAINPKALRIASNLASAYLFDNQFEKAKEICLQHQHEKVDGAVPFPEVVLNDFKQLKEHAITHPDTEKIAQLFQSEAKSSSR